MIPNTLLHRLTPWCAAAFGMSLLFAACAAESDDPTGAYAGYYRGGTPRPVVLPTPTLVNVGGAPAAPPVGGAAGSAMTAGGSGGTAGSGGAPDAGGLSGASGSAGSGGGTVGPPPEDCDAPDEFLQDKCGTAGCHSAGAMIGEFGAGPDEAEGYIDQPPTIQDEACGLIIDTANPLQSLLLTKTNGEAPDGCGAPMPLGGGTLTPAETECLIGWISNL